MLLFHFNVAALLLLLPCALLSRGAFLQTTPQSRHPKSPSPSGGTRCSSNHASLTLHRISWSDITDAARHLVEGKESDGSSGPETSVSALESLSNAEIESTGGGRILAYAARPPSADGDEEEAGRSTPVLILLHEFFGLNPSIASKADALSEKLGCLVVAPDTFRGVTTTFIPRAIWLALTTPQERVNNDLDDVVRWAQETGVARSSSSGTVPSKVAVMGFCYGGGKALRYATQRLPAAATVVCYGSPVVDVEAMKVLEGPVCGVFGERDAQFPPPLLEAFRRALEDAGITNDIRVYPGVGHAFWSDMGQVERGEQPQTAAWEQCTEFLAEFFSS